MHRLAISGVDGQSKNRTDKGTSTCISLKSNTSLDVEIQDRSDVFEETSNRIRNYPAVTPVGNVAGGCVAGTGCPFYELKGRFVVGSVGNFMTGPRASGAVEPRPQNVPVLGLRRKSVIESMGKPLIGSMTGSRSTVMSGVTASPVCGLMRRPLRRLIGKPVPVSTGGG